MQRLLVTTSTLPRWDGDSEPRFVLDLAHHIKPWFEPTILAPVFPGAAMQENLDDVAVIRYPYAPFRYMETLCYPGAIDSQIRRNPVKLLLVPLLLCGLARAVRKELSRGDYAAVHAHWFLPQGLVQATLDGPHKPPFVVTSHGGDLALGSRAWCRPALRTILRRAAAVTVVSPDLLDSLRALDPTYGVENIPVIPMGVDLTRFSSARRREDWVVENQLRPPVVLFAGRLVEKKGLGYLIEAFNRSPLSQVQISLAIAGEGPSERRLRDLVRSQGLDDRVRFLGAIPHDQLAEAYASCDIFCLPSVQAKSGDRDGMPTVLCEAGASGLPLVASQIAGIPLMVRHKETGLLVPPNDTTALSEALYRLATDPSLRACYGQAAADHVADFSWQRIAERFAAVFQEAISRSQFFDRDRTG